MPAVIKPAIKGQAADGEKSAVEYETECDDITVRYLDLTTNEITEMYLEDYVSKALSALMDDDAPLEALKAQAVAIRSVVCYRYENCENKEAPLCSDGEHCFSLDNIPKENCIRAACETAGIILTWEGKAVLALSHPSSRIKTEDYETVYGSKLEYLVSVSVYDESDMADYKKVIKMKSEDFKSAFSDYTVIFSDNKEKWVGTVELTNGGRVYTAEVGGLRFKGSTLASLLGLDSLCFTLEVKEDEVLIHSYGKGHGIGMSRNTAVLMAEEGKGYKTILKHFYPQTAFSEIKTHKQN